MSKHFLRGFWIILSVLARYLLLTHLFRNPQWVKRRFTSTLSSLAMSTLASRLPLVT
ncbi:unnamed protein product, partial [Vitis vinifera]